MSLLVLAADIGGTKSNLGLFEAIGDTLEPVEERQYYSADFSGPGPIFTDFLKHKTTDVSAACLAIAGPVVDGKCKVTNLPWMVDEAELATATGLRTVRLINDLEATAYGLAELDPSSFVDLNPGAKVRPGNAALIAAGTGLGEAILFWDGTKHRPSASEGGHVDFGPTSELEVELYRHFTAKYGRATYDRIVSGPGLLDIYLFLRDSGRGKEPPGLTERLEGDDPSAVIAHEGLGDPGGLCGLALGLFVRLYGAEAGNLALGAMAVGGVYVGGGVAPKILPALESGAFMEGFLNKGGMRHLVEKMPVRVVTEPRTALWGAARYALGLVTPA